MWLSPLKVILVPSDRLVKMWSPAPKMLTIHDRSPGKPSLFPGAPFPQKHGGKGRLSLL